MTLPIDLRPQPLHIPASGTPSSPFSSRPVAPSGAPEEGGFRAALARAASRLAEGDASMDRAMQRAMRGDGLDQAELIALQSGVYRYSQEMEMASRLVDRATQAVKTTLQSQT